MYTCTAEQHSDHTIENMTYLSQANSCLFAHLLFTIICTCMNESWLHPRQVHKSTSVHSSHLLVQTLTLLPPHLLLHSRGHPCSSALLKGSSYQQKCHSQKLQNTVTTNNSQQSLITYSTGEQQQWLSSKPAHTQSLLAFHAMCTLLALLCRMSGQ